MGKPSIWDFLRKLSLMNTDFDKLYLRANLHSSFRLIARFALELQHFVSISAHFLTVQTYKRMCLTIRVYGTPGFPKYDHILTCLYQVVFH